MTTRMAGDCVLTTHGREIIGLKPENKSIGDFSNSPSTITLGADAEPEVSLCMGHVTTKAFNAAFKREGWNKVDWVYQDELAYEYWLPVRDGYKKSTKDTPGSLPVTVLRW